MKDKIEILFMTLKVKILSRRTLYFTAFQKESSFLRKKIPDSCDMNF